MFLDDEDGVVVVVGLLRSTCLWLRERIELDTNFKARYFQFILPPDQS